MGSRRYCGTIHIPINVGAVMSNIDEDYEFACNLLNEVDAKVKEQAAEIERLKTELAELKKKLPDKFTPWVEQDWKPEDSFMDGV